MIDEFTDLMDSGLVVRVVMDRTEVRLITTNSTSPIILPYNDERLLIEVMSFFYQNGFEYAPLILMDGLDEWRLKFTKEEILCLLKYSKTNLGITIPITDLFPITYDDLLA